MPLRWWKPGALVGALALFATLAAGAPVQAEGWGTIKGQVVWGPAEPPKPEKLNVDKDQAHCLSKGPLYSDRYVVNPRNKGVRWVVVWLTDAKDPKKGLPINPSLKAIKDKEAVLDQPCCKFEPHILTMRQGQTLVVKNSAPIPHNVNVTGGALGPNFNVLLPPGASKTEEGIVGRPTPLLVSCNIHPWMKGYIRVFKDPYFAVTDDDGKFEIKDAPVGKHRLVVWQESTGWVTGGKLGTPVTIKPEEVTNLGKIKLTPSED